MELEQPLFILLFLFLPIIFLLYKKKNKSDNSFVIPLVSTYSGKQSNKKYFIGLSNIIQTFLICLTILALMQPVLKDVKQIKNYEGIDIILAIDCSNSMLATDLTPNRLTVAKENAIKFISKRENDRIGITIFAGESITVSPLTTNYSFLKNKISEIKTGQLAAGTAIGVGIATALLRLSDSVGHMQYAPTVGAYCIRPTKIIILITDGANNSGNISPCDAVRVAKEMDVKIYTIAIGKDAKVKIQFSPTEIIEIEDSFDEELLREIAKATNAKFFNATNSSELSNIYSEIDKLERTPYTVETVSNNIYLSKYLICLMIIFLIFEIVLRATVLKYV